MEPHRPGRIAGSIRSWPAAVSGLLLLISFLTVGGASVFYQIPRVGDGSEYYAMTLALKTTARPFMTPQAWSAYDDLFDSRRIPQLVETRRMKAVHPRLISGDTRDFNHFWLYGLPPAVIGIAADAAFLEVDPTLWFLLWHSLLLFAALATVRRFHGLLGVACALVLILASPMLWFVDKVHTEFFTFCLTLAAVVLLRNRRYPQAAVVFAIAATQNPPISVMCLMILAYFLIDRGLRNFKKNDVFLIVLTVMTLALHPIYYLLRQGVVTPQLKAGGAEIGWQIEYAYVWLFDPDVGLFFNWPLGAVIIFVFLGVSLRGTTGERRSHAWPWILGLYVVFMLILQSMSTNYNGGATVHIARYATWYIPLFFPMLLNIFWYMKEKRITTRYAVSSLLFFYFVGNVAIFNQTRPETYVRPTAVSKRLQSYLPGWFDPHPEIFAERFSGVDGALRRFAVITTRNCRKALVNVHRLPAITDPVGLVAGCRLPIEPEALIGLLRSRVGGRSGGEWQYVVLSTDDVRSLLR